VTATRRDFLRQSASVVVAAAFVPKSSPSPSPSPSPSQPLSRLAVHPRSDWGARLPPKGPLSVERSADVRFLLVHHTATPNAYARDDVPRLIRGFYELHTGPRKNWPDVAYNFFVDRFGEIWEAREGSLLRPVKGDATGGSQGFALLCCFIGDHQTEPPTRTAQAAMARLLAALADTYGIDTRRGATTTFVSRGSSKWARGVRVTAATISGHRDMARTVCPGGAAYTIVRGTLPDDVTALRGLVPAGSYSPVDADPRERRVVPSPRYAAHSVASAPPAARPAASSRPVPWEPPSVGGALAAAAAALTAIAVRRRNVAPAEWRWSVDGHPHVPAQPQPIETGSSAMAFDRITTDPGRMGGEPCIRDLRLTVAMLLDAFAEGATVEELLDDYPYLEQEDIDQALAYAGRGVH
jgi:uncharacterized protein (DUF433 family)